jgi:hypothetical protein
MATTNQTMPEQVRELRVSAKNVLGGTITESFASGAAIVLTLLGLGGIKPDLMLSIAVIIIGVAFLFEGIAISMRFSKLLSETSKDRLEKAEFGIGLTSEYLGGIVGIILGILSLLGIDPMILVPAAAIVFGLAFILSSGVTYRLDALEIEGTESSTRFKKIAHEAVKVSALLEYVLGSGAIVLGIIGLAGLHMATAGFVTVISLVSLLILGIAGLVTGTAVTSRMISLIQKSS